MCLSLGDRNWCLSKRRQRDALRSGLGDNGRLRIVPQPIETLSDLVTEDPDSDHLAKLEENAQAKRNVQRLQELLDAKDLEIGRLQQQALLWCQGLSACKQLLNIDWCQVLQYLAATLQRFVIAEQDQLVGTD